MKDLIYKMYSVYLYDDQLNHDFVILYNRTKSFTGDEVCDIPHYFSDAMQIIYEKCYRSHQSIRQMEFAYNRCLGLYKTLFLNAKKYITFEKVKSTHLPKYNAYNIFWNETKSGVNIHDFEVAAIWNTGGSTYSPYRILEFKHERDRQIRENKLIELGV